MRVVINKNISNSFVADEIFIKKENNFSNDLKEGDFLSIPLAKEKDMLRKYWNER